VREELTSALAGGRGVTAKIRWISGRRGEEHEGRTRWIHCTPLLGKNGSVGVWMIVLVDEDGSAPVRRFKLAPPVASDLRSAEASPALTGRSSIGRRYSSAASMDGGQSIESFAL
jgi:hypothetical protein